MKRDPLRKAERAQKRMEKKENGAAKHELAKDLSSVSAIDVLEKDASKHRTRKRPAGNTVAAVGRTGRKQVPAALKHVVMLRDAGSCSYITASGTRCGSKIGIQIDHKNPVALGGGNDEKNLRLLCREHNIIAAQALLGEAVMSGYLSSPT